MTRLVKRSATTSYDRARPPKRRKTAGSGVGTPVDLTQDPPKEESEELGASDQSTQVEEKQWLANRILDERGKGNRKHYLVAWEPVDGRTFKPTWVGRAQRTGCKLLTQS